MTLIIKDNGLRKLAFDPERLSASLDATTAAIEDIDLERYKDHVIRAISQKDELRVDELTDYLIREADSYTTIEEPNWDKVAAALYLKRLYKRASKNRFSTPKKPYGSFVGLLENLGERGVYDASLFQKYSTKELEEYAKLIKPERDALFTYNGLNLLASRYLATDNTRQTFELPQERWLIIALFLMQNESQRKKHVKAAYHALSNLYLTVATPTLANAGKTNSQLSSCFINTVEDSLQSIYDSNTDVARVSKHGGGVGVYIGNVRPLGSDIRGVPSASGGVIPWIKQLNNTAVSVDQLGQRKGAINVTLDVFHKDIMPFLDLRLNNGDQRLRAHDIFTTVAIPDLFMEQVEKRGDWCLFDPREVEKKKGWRLQNNYDKKAGDGEFRRRYRELVEDNNITKITIPAIDIMKRIMVSQLETGTPFMFYRDTVNRANPNRHKGMIYSSNLCMEICQNMKGDEFLQEVVSGDQIITTKRAGDFVVCNLSSLNLGALKRAEGDMALADIIAIQVRMLDNVIDLNNLPLPQATITNQRYRAIGLGTFGWHHYLALKEIEWESPEAVTEADLLYNEINRLAVRASALLAKEKGSYPYYEGSDWDTGEYFEQRGYHKQQEWDEVRSLVKGHGLRNGYLLAVAPNMSTAQIAGSTASIDPIYSPFYYEEKKDFRRPVIAPDLSPETYPSYAKGAYHLDQFASLRQNAMRQRHVDQAISFNFYVPSTIRATVLLDLHMTAWSLGIKTTYYTRSNDISIEECEWCSA